MGAVAAVGGRSALLILHVKATEVEGVRNYPKSPEVVIQPLILRSSRIAASIEAAVAVTVVAAVEEKPTTMLG